MADCRNLICQMHTLIKHSGMLNVTRAHQDFGLHNCQQAADGKPWLRFQQGHGTLLEVLDLGQDLIGPQVLSACFWQGCIGHDGIDLGQSQIPSYDDE